MGWGARGQTKKQHVRAKAAERTPHSGLISVSLLKTGDFILEIDLTLAILTKFQILHRYSISNDDHWQTLCTYHDMNGQRSVVCTCIGACAYFELQYYYCIIIETIWSPCFPMIQSLSNTYLQYFLTASHTGGAMAWLSARAAVDLERTGTSFWLRKKRFCIWTGVTFMVVVVGGWFMLVACF